MMRRRGRAQAQKGQALVEFGIVSLTLMLLLVNIVDLMRGFWYFNTLGYAVREGTRYASVHGSSSDSPVSSSDPTPVVQVVRDQSTGLDAGLMSVTVTWLDGTNAPGSRVQVEATYNFQPILMGWLSLDLSSRSQIVIEL